MVEIKAYSDLYNVSFESWEVDALIALGRLRLKDYSKGR